MLACSQRVRRGTAVCLLLLAACANEAPRPARETAPLMPKDLTGLYLGMPFHELKTLRPRLFPASEDGPDAFMERGLESPFYTTIDYVCPTAGLIKVSLARSFGDHAFIERHRAGFLVGVLRKWGSPSERYVGDQLAMASDAVHHFPVLIWRRHPATIAVAYTPSQDLDGRQFNLAERPEDRVRVFFFWTMLFGPSVDLEDAFEDIRLRRASDVTGGSSLFVDLEALNTATEQPVFE